MLPAASGGMLACTLLLCFNLLRLLFGEAFGEALLTRKSSALAFALIWILVKNYSIVVLAPEQTYSVSLALALNTAVHLVMQLYSGCLTI